MCFFRIFRYLKKIITVHQEKFATIYNWKYVFKSQKTNMETRNAISLIKLSAL